jgi:hypothetical protein
MDHAGVMLRLTSLLGLFVAGLACAQSDALPDLPDPLGRAGMVAAVLREADGSEIIIAAGGTNFPDKPLWQGGQRKYHKDILKLSRKDGVWSWHKIGDLPEGLVGAAFCPTPKRDGLVIAGGASAERHCADVWLVGLDGKVTRFAESMAHPRAYAGFTSSNGHLIIVGGIARPDDTAAIATNLGAPPTPIRPTDGSSHSLAPACVNSSGAAAVRYQRRTVSRSATTRRTSPTNPPTAKATASTAYPTSSPAPLARACCRRRIYSLSVATTAPNMATPTKRTRAWRVVSSP